MDGFRGASTRDVYLSNSFSNPKTTNNMWPAILAAGISATNSMLGGFAQNVANKKAIQQQYDNWLKSYNIQRNDNLTDYANQLKDQRQLMIDEASLKKLGLEKAGINTANQVGNMSLGASPSADISSASGQLFQTYNTTPFTSFTSALERLSDPLYGLQLKKLKADTDKTEADTDKTLTETEQAQLNLDVYRQTMQTLVATSNEQLEALRKANKISDKEYEKILVDIDTANANYDYLTKQIAKFEQFTPKEYEQLEDIIRKLKADIRGSNASAYSTELDNFFKSKGIFPNGDFFGNLLGMSLMGQTGDVVHSFVAGICDGVSRLFNDAKEAYDKNAPTAKNILAETKKDLKNFFKPPYRSIYINKNGKATIFWHRFIKGKWTSEKAKDQRIPAKYQKDVDHMRWYHKQNSVNWQYRHSIRIKDE